MKDNASRLAAFRPKDGTLYFLPLGGTEEFGINVNLYGWGDEWIMVDLGMGFADETMPGIDLLMPDISFISDDPKRCKGLVITHGHEDHIGAIPYLWEDLRCPIYATPFTAGLIRRKFIDEGLQGANHVREIEPGQPFTVGPFGLEYVRVAHSIPDSCSLIIESPAGKVLHTGDWKIDPDPVVGYTTDEARFRQLGEEGVLAMIGDSTNAGSGGQIGSEAELFESFRDLFETHHGRVVVSCFSSNVARMVTVARAAEAADRHVALVGRSLKRIESVARDRGLLTDVPEFLSDDQIGYLPRDKAVLIVTGSQGEPRAALNRIAADDHPQVALDPGDTVVFSSRTIPGNEKAVGRLQNKLLRLGCTIVGASDAKVHVSGHGSRNDMAEMYQWVRPAIALPVHGEHQHLRNHAALAHDCQVGQVIVPENGQAIRLGPGTPGIEGEVDHGLVAVDGRRLISLDMDGPVKERQRLMHNGAAHVTVVVNRRGDLVADPQFHMTGLVGAGEAEDALDELHDAVLDMMDALTPVERKTDGDISEKVRIAARRTLRSLFDKKPVVTVSVVRV